MVYYMTRQVIKRVNYSVNPQIILKFWYFLIDLSNQSIDSLILVYSEVSTELDFFFFQIETHVVSA